MSILSRFTSWVRNSRRRHAQIRPPAPTPTQKALRDAVGPRGPSTWFGRQAAWNVYDVVTEGAERYEESFEHRDRES